MEQAMSGDISFAVDGMLGRLGKYLRALGFDTLYAPRLGENIFRKCEEEDRVLVTVRKNIPRDFAGRLVLVGEGQVEDQLAKVFRKLGVKPGRARLLTICMDCNRPTEEVPVEEAADKVPPGVKEKFSSFRRCPSCGKVFWWGSHADRIVERLMKSGVLD
jgi:uncharacterized protein with PIN domain